MRRLFFALQPAADQRHALAEQVAPLVAQLKAQRVSAENLHATLCFIGAVPEENLAALEAAAADVAGQRAALQFDALEYWRKPGVLCATAGETSASAPARVLAERLAQTTIAAGFSPDHKPFRAHLTLARKVHAGHAGELDWPRVLTPPMTLHCDRFVLMESRRSESGSIYSVVNSWPLDDDKSR